MQKKILFLDGLMVPASQSFLKALSPGILAGTGVFETMRAYSGRIFALDEHLARLWDGFESLRIRPSFSKQKIEEHLYTTLRSNKLKNARLRLTVWRGGQGLRTSIIAGAYRPFSKLVYSQGFKAIISDIRRDETKANVRIKSINYLPLMIALHRAKIKGNDEAILLNQKGCVVEGSRSNIFCVKKDRLYTPALSCGCLNGVTRKIVIKLAQQLKLNCQEGCLLPKDLLSAGEAFLTNSLVELIPLTSLHGRRIGLGKIGPITQLLLDNYRQLIKNSLS